MLRLYHICAYWFALLAFGAVALALNAVCAVLLILPGRKRRAPAIREAIRRLFDKWIGGLHAFRLVTVTWHGLDEAPLARPAVYVANHPSLIDATILLAQLPDAVCVFKPALSRNPLLAPAALMAGYSSGSAGVDLVRDLAGKVAAGCTLLIFPEGTRTAGADGFNRLKPGFALIARRARVPVQVLIIRTDRKLLTGGPLPWLRPPRFPVHFDVHVDRLLPFDPDISCEQRVAEVETIFAARLRASP
jgi:1-acyl-sn-glycerol-3-phosphate acyltransferase